MSVQCVNDFQIMVVDVKLEEEKDQPKVLDVCTQTPKGGRSGGRASRMRSFLPTN